MPNIFPYFYKEYDFPCPETPYSCNPITVVLPPASYEIELFGASGANSSKENQPAYGGKGGYTKGRIILRKQTTLYLYIGGVGSIQPNEPGKGGWNGGGTSTPSRAGGGGATDIRYRDGDFDNEESLDSRILVAGGGGGSYRGADCYVDGGNGGGETGQSSTEIKGCKPNNLIIPCYGGQESCEGGDDNSEDSKSGTKGKGGDGIAEFAPGGGGGYYGGGSSLRGSGGGSGYIKGTSEYKVKYGETQIGVHNGSGKAIITQVTNFSCVTSTISFSFHKLLLLIIITIIK